MNNIQYSTFQQLTVAAITTATGTSRTFATGLPSVIQWPLNPNRIQVLEIGIDGAYVGGVAPFNFPIPCIEYYCFITLQQNANNISFGYSNDSNDPQLYLNNDDPGHRLGDEVYCNNILIATNGVAFDPGVTLPLSFIGFHYYMRYRDAAEGPVRDYDSPGMIQPCE